VCTPCLNKVENVLRKLEKKQGLKNTRSNQPKALQPLGKFLCPVCNTSHTISRLGVSVLPLSMALHNNSLYGDKERCSTHLSSAERFCVTCNKQVCKECLEDNHDLHHVEDMQRIRRSLDRSLKNAAKEISDRMKTIETDIARIRVAREAEVNERRKLRREVVTYYEGYVNHVNKHKTELEKKISTHHEKSENILIKEELQLEQYRMDLRFLCSQIQKLLSLKNSMEVLKLMAPVTKKLEKISGEILTTGEAIINKLQFVPKSLSYGDIPGFLSTFSVCPGKSHAIIDRPIYEKVICSIRLHLADDNGLKLDVYRDIDIQAVMTLYHMEDKTCQMVGVRVENNDHWSLVFTPPYPGIATLSVTVDGQHIKNSPYVITVRTLQLDNNTNNMHKKKVQFNKISL